MGKFLVLGKRAPGDTAEHLHHLFLGPSHMADVEEAFEGNMPAQCLVIGGFGLSLVLLGHCQSTPHMTSHKILEKICPYVHIFERGQGQEPDFSNSGWT